MKGSVLPEAIQKAVGTEKYMVDKIGESQGICQLCIEDTTP